MPGGTIKAKHQAKDRTKVKPKISPTRSTTLENGRLDGKKEKESRRKWPGGMSGAFEYITN